jgi:hypothetical protein
MNKTATHKEEVNLPDEMVMNQIYVIRGQKVMLDRYLAELYGVETRVLNQAVNRNLDRFPEDFMFQLTKEELDNLKSQFVISSWGGHRKLPNVFTEHGVLMLSSVLNSKQAIQVNIQIMRIFTKVRKMLLDNTSIQLEIAEIKQAINKIAKKQDGHDKNIDLLFEYIDRLQEKTEETKQERKRIGFKEW